MERACGRVECIDLAVHEAEVANQQIVAEVPETGRRKGNAPGCGKYAASDEPLQGPPFSSNTFTTPGPV